MRIYMRRWDAMTGSVIILQARKVAGRIEILPGSAVVIDESGEVDYQPNYYGLCYEENYVIVEDYMLIQNNHNWDIKEVRDYVNLYMRLELV